MYILQVVPLLIESMLRAYAMHLSASAYYLCYSSSSIDRDCTYLGNNTANIARKPWYLTLWWVYLLGFTFVPFVNFPEARLHFYLHLWNGDWKGKDHVHWILAAVLRCYWPLGIALLCPLTVGRKRTWVCTRKRKTIFLLLSLSNHLRYGRVLLAILWMF